VKRYTDKDLLKENSHLPAIEKIPYNPFQYKRRNTFLVNNMGAHSVPVVVADFSKKENITAKDLQSIGYTYDEATDKWNITEAAADYIYCTHPLTFSLPGMLKVIIHYTSWKNITDKEKYFPIMDGEAYLNDTVEKSSFINFIMIDCYSHNNIYPAGNALFSALKQDATAVICLSAENKNAMQSVRRMFMQLMENEVQNPAIIVCDSNWQTADEHLIHYATECGALLLDGFWRWHITGNDEKQLWACAGK